jgi:hypothetical protein
MVKRKVRLWTQYTETKREDITSEYKKVRNSLRMETTKAAKEEYDIIAAACQQNQKTFGIISIAGKTA